MQARHDIQGLHKITPFLHHIFCFEVLFLVAHRMMSGIKKCRDGVTCIVCVFAHYHPYTYIHVHVVAVSFGTAIPTSLYIFGECFLYLYTCTCRYN